MSRTIEEILEAIDPDAARAALNEKRKTIETLLSAAAVSYSLEKSNPLASPDDPAKVLAEIERQILLFDWALTEIDARLASSKESLLRSSSPDKEVTA
jgi:hypothetical protein